MTERCLRPGDRRYRIGVTVFAACVSALALAQLLQLVQGDGGLRDVLRVIMTGFLAGCFLLIAVQFWRAEISISDDGIAVDNGIGRVRSVPWEHVAGFRLPSGPRDRPVIEVREGSDIVLGSAHPLAPPGLAMDQLIELDRLVSRHTSS